MASIKYYLHQIFKDAKAQKKAKEYRKGRKPYPATLLRGKPSSVRLILTPDTGSPIKIKTSKKIEPKYWDFSQGKPKSNYTGGVEMNIDLDNWKSEVGIFYNTAVKDPSVTRSKVTEGVKKIISGISLENNSTFFDELKGFIDIQSDIREERTIKRYVTLFNSLNGFQSAKGYELTFESIDLNFYDLYKAYLLRKPNPNYNGKVLVKSEERNCYIIVDAGSDQGIKVGLFKYTNLGKIWERNT